MGAEGGLIVALAVDTSGSMKKTDPLGLRRDAARLIGSLLSEEDRLALVTFDTHAQVRFALDCPAANESDFHSRLGSIHSNGLFTNLYEAVDVSRKALADAPQGRKAIILLTDGKMDTGDPLRDGQLKERLLNDLVPALVEENTPIYSIAFTPFSDATLLFDLAVKTRGFFYVAEHASQIHEVLTRAYENLGHPDALCVRGKTFHVDPAVDAMTILVTKENPAEEVRLKTPARVSLSPAHHPPGGRWITANAFDMVVIQKPQEGTWEFEHGADGKKNVYVHTDFKLETSFREPTIPLSFQGPVEIWLEGQNGRLSPESLNDRRIEFRCELETPLRTRVPVSLRDDGLSADRVRADGVFTGILKTSEPGEYRLIVGAVGAGFDRQITREFWVLPQKDDTDGGQKQGLAATLHGPFPSTESPPSPDRSLPGSIPVGHGPNLTLYGMVLFGGYGAFMSGLCLYFYRRWKGALRSSRDTQPTLNSEEPLRSHQERAASDELLERQNAEEGDRLENSFEETIIGTQEKTTHTAPEASAEGETSRIPSGDSFELLSDLATRFQTYLKYQELRMMEFQHAEKAVANFREKVREMTKRHRELALSVQAFQNHPTDLSNGWNQLVEELEKTNSELRASLQELEQEHLLQEQRRRKFQDRMSGEVEKILAGLLGKEHFTSPEACMGSDQKASCSPSEMRIQELTENLLEMEKELLKLRQNLADLEREYMRNYQLPAYPPAGPGIPGKV